MTTTRNRPRSSQQRARDRRAEAARRKARRRLLVRGGLVAVAVVAVLFLVFTLRGGGDSAGGGPTFQVGSPGPGEAAPPIQLPSTGGDTWDLAGARGETVLLYFQEGLMCQPCWDQITDIEDRMDELRALGVDQFVSITSDPLDLIEEKVADEGIETPVLADEGLTLADAYTTNQYGMMGTSRYGHSFILVDPDGRIEWRADYGGPPQHTMFVPVDELLADLRAGVAAAP